MSIAIVIATMQGNALLIQVVDTEWYLAKEALG